MPLQERRLAVAEIEVPCPDEAIVEAERADLVDPAIVSRQLVPGDLAVPSRYLLIEYWSEMVVYERHVADYQRDMALLERQREALTDSVESLGVFSALDVPDRAGPAWSRRDGR